MRGTIAFELQDNILPRTCPAETLVSQNLKNLTEIPVVLERRHGDNILMNIANYILLLRLVTDAYKRARNLRINFVVKNPH